MRETARKVFGDELAERVNDFGGFDDDGETRGMWRRSGHSGFWFFGGIWRSVGFNRGCWLCRLRLLRLDSRKLDISLSLLCDDMFLRRKSIEIYWGSFTVGIPEMNSMGNSLNRVADSCASQASM